jgi:pyruvate dehydrogenase E1 component beta subunit
MESTDSPKETSDDRNITMAAAIGEAVALEMERDESVIVMGEDVGVYGGVSAHLTGLYDRFGEHRVRDTPISEAGFIGAASGAAVAGMRPVVELMLIDFFGVAMDQIYNYMAKLHYASGGRRRAPVVLLAGTGNPLRQGISHSQTLHGLFAHLPGLKVVSPSNPYDAKGLLISAIRDDSPVLYLFHKILLELKALSGTSPGVLPEEVPSESYVLDIGRADVKRAGSDVTIVTLSYMVLQSLRAAEELEREGIDAEVLDLRTVVPLDREAILASVAKTGRLLVVDEDYRGFGLTGEVITSVVERDPSLLKAPPVRLAREDAPIPYSRVLEDVVVPNVGTIAEAVRKLVGRKAAAPEVN